MSNFEMSKERFENALKMLKLFDFGIYEGEEHEDTNNLNETPENINESEVKSLNLNNIVKIETISEEKLNHYLTRGWRIQKQTDKGEYTVGLPLEQAYQQLLELSRYFLHKEAIKHEFERRAKLYGKKFDDYEQAPREKVKGYNKNNEAYTHFIEKGDLFNQNINEFFAIIKPCQDYLFAKPLKKKDTPAH